jgi:predicted RNase H-like nuclease (RuvC/YqgF family)
MFGTMRESLTATAAVVLLATYHWWVTKSRNLEKSRSKVEMEQHRKRINELEQTLQEAGDKNRDTKSAMCRLQEELERLRGNAVDLENELEQARRVAEERMEELRCLNETFRQEAGRRRSHYDYSLSKLLELYGKITDAYNASYGSSSLREIKTLCDQAFRREDIAVLGCVGERYDSKIHYHVGPNAVPGMIVGHVDRYGYIKDGIHTRAHVKLIMGPTSR